MPCSLAQIEANRKNASQSTGPKTPEGKAASRANGYKHGLTGEGIVLPTEDAEELDERFAILEAEMKPRNELARQLVSRIAFLMLKLERAARHESKAIGYKMRQARDNFDDARKSEVENYYNWIAAEPATNARRLRRTPEGVDRLLQTFDDLKTDLSNSYAMQWGWQHCELLHHIMGLRRTDLPVSRAHALTEAIAGRFHFLRPEDGEGLEPVERMAWAREAQIELLDREIAGLQALRAEFDHEGLERDRDEAADRAMFDASPEAVLARKYEAACERGLYKAIREFREFQGDETEVEAGTVVADPPAEELASCLPDPGEDDNESIDMDSNVEKAAPPLDRPPGKRPKVPRKSGKRPKR